MDSNMGLLEWLLVFDKITFAEYAIINVALIAVFGIALLIYIKKNRH